MEGIVIESTGSWYNVLSSDGTYTKCKLKGKFKGTEIALSIASGSGKEHMALISALMSVPVGVRFTALTKEGIIFM